MSLIVEHVKVTGIQLTLLGGGTDKDGVTHLNVQHMTLPISYRATVRITNTYAVEVLVSGEFLDDMDPLNVRRLPLYGNGAERHTLILPGGTVDIVSTMVQVSIGFAIKTLVLTNHPKPWVGLPEDATKLVASVL
jgi:hypothetical protein